MELIEFAEKYGYVIIKSSNEFTIPELQKFQKDWFNEVNQNKYTITLKSRQMYLTTMEAIYCAWFLIFNKDEKNKIFLKSNNLSGGKRILEIVRLILVYYYEKNNEKLAPKINNQVELQLINNNLIKVISGVNSFCLQDKIHTLIIDEAAFINDLEDILKTAYVYNLEKFIIGSTDNKEQNYFHSLYFSNFVIYKHWRRIKLHYSENKHYNNDNWLRGIENIFNNENDFKYQVTLDIPIVQEIVKKTESKSEIKPTRFTNDMLNNIGKRLIQLDVNLSDYIRNLVAKDLKENNII